MIRLLLIFLMMSLSPLGYAQTIYLRDNRLIKADILKEDETRVVVDLGFDILQIPKTEIVKIEKEVGGSAENVRQIGLYSVTDLTETTIKDNVERFGEAVVKVATPAGLGSGFIIHKDGYIVTNFHVIEGERKITVTVFKQKGKELEKEIYPYVKIVALNPFLDMALLKIVPDPKKPEEKIPEFQIVYLGNIAGVTEGNKVFCIGNPLGMERSVSDGIISSSKRQFNGLVYLQSTAPINPGNSGGPLFNLKGEVIGITNMKVMFGDNLGFAIPVNELQSFLNNLDAFLFDKDNPNSGVIYFEPPRKKIRE